MSLARVLIVAGSDSSGGAGIQADLNTVTSLGGYGMTAITALTAQNTLGVQAIHPVPPAFVAQQIRACLDDIGADAIKIGMLFSAAIIDAVADALPTGIPIVLDPVMIAKGGAALLEPDAVAALQSRLIPRAALITPNLPEAEFLLGHAIEGMDAMRAAAVTLREFGSGAVLLKGGHASGAVVSDLLATADGIVTLQSTRHATPHTHGTGCTLASAIATGLAQGMGLEPAVARAHAYVQAAIEAAPGLGQGHGPLGHHAAAGECST